ncbi:MAG: response regulator [Flavobacterium sp.]|nr:response regulator [Flavobacterium sp.]
MTTDIHTKFERVMIIDDNIIDLYITKRLIIKTNFGKNVLEYFSAEKALKYLQDHQETISMWPQIIFIDIYMPVMSGFEFLEGYDLLPAKLKKNCKAFIISSSIDDNDIARSRLDKNLTAFQVKPITKEFLDSIAAD